MARKNYLFTSESVSEGHPDKVCDRISDEIVDLFYREAAKNGTDPQSVRVACETMCTTNRVIIAGEYRGPKSVTHDLIANTARNAIRDIGYEQEGFHWKHANVEVLLHGQSADIAQGVDAAGNKDVGAGDQGIMFGYACDETPELMPAPIYYAHQILEKLSDARRSGKEKDLGPDAKSQVTVQYKDGKAVGVTQIVVSHQHTNEDLSSEDVRGIVEPHVRKALPKEWISEDTVWHVNPTRIDVPDRVLAEISSLGSALRTCGSTMPRKKGREYLIGMLMGNYDLRYADHNASPCTEPSLGFQRRGRDPFFCLFLLPLSTHSGILMGIIDRSRDFLGFITDIAELMP